MPLIICPDCHKEISDKAPTCPHCGHPFTPQTIQGTAKTEGIFMQSLNCGCYFILAFVGFLILLGILSVTSHSK